jgi:hypothetical protein
MAVVDSHVCNWEASGCVRRSFFVCFWYDLRAAWKIAWNREEAAVSAGVWDMTSASDGGGTYEVMRRTGDGVNKDCEHWARGF